MKSFLFPENIAVLINVRNAATYDVIQCLFE